MSAPDGAAEVIAAAKELAEWLDCDDLDGRTERLLFRLQEALLTHERRWLAKETAG